MCLAVHAGALDVFQRVEWARICQKLAPSATYNRMFMRPTNVKYAVSDPRPDGTTLRGPLEPPSH